IPVEGKAADDIAAMVANLHKQDVAVNRQMTVREYFWRPFRKRLADLAVGDTSDTDPATVAATYIARAVWLALRRGEEGAKLLRPWATQAVKYASGLTLDKEEAEIIGHPLAPLPYLDTRD